MSTSQEGEDRVELTPEQAIAMLPDGDDIHTFRNPGVGMMVGAQPPSALKAEAPRETNREPPYLVRSFWGPGRVCLITVHFTDGEIVTVQDDNGREWEAASPQEDMTGIGSQKKTNPKPPCVFRGGCKYEPNCTEHCQGPI